MAPCPADRAAKKNEKNKNVTKTQNLSKEESSPEKQIFTVSSFRRNYDNRPKKPRAPHPIFGWRGGGRKTSGDFPYHKIKRFANKNYRVGTPTKLPHKISFSQSSLPLTEKDNREEKTKIRSSDLG